MLVPVLRLVVPVSLASLALASCTSAVDPPMTRSCRGEYVDACRPYTYARVTSATLDPERIILNDPAMRAHVHVELETCGMAPAAPTVNISAFIGGGDATIAEPDGGSSSARVIQLTTVGPPAAGASSIDVMIDNPFFANVPPNSRITLQFAPIIDDCEGELFETPYQTGPLVATP